MQHPLKKHYYRYIVGFLALWLSPLCCGQVVSIRVVNANNGHPLPKQNISVQLWYEKGAKTPAKFDANLSLETDGNGEAQFSLPEPAPVEVAAQVRLSSEHWHCACFAMIATQDLVQKGIVRATGPDSTTSATNAKAGPGVILFLVRPFTWIERLIYPIMKY